MAESEEGSISTARMMFGVLAVMKLIAALFGVRLLFGVPHVPERAIGDMLNQHQHLVATALILYFGAQFSLCLVLSRGLKLRRPWAYTAGYIYSGFHIAGALAFFLGPVLLINAALGVTAFIYLRKASALRVATGDESSLDDR